MYGTWEWRKVKYGWHASGLFSSLVEWLNNRSNSHTDWLSDGSKYVDIRFDSRTGNFIVRHDSDPELLLMWFPPESEEV